MKNRNCKCTDILTNQIYQNFHSNSFNANMDNNDQF